MAGKGFRLTWSPTTSGGTVSESMSSWPQIVNGSATLDQVIINAGKNVTFNFRIVSPTGNNAYVSKGNNEVLNDRPNILMKGLYTLVIEEASSDFSPTTEFMFYDKKVKRERGMVSYCWFVWDKKYKGKPYIDWIFYEKE